MLARFHMLTISSHADYKLNLVCEHEISHCCKQENNLKFQLSDSAETCKAGKKSKWIALTSVERISDSPPEGSFSPQSQSNPRQQSQDRVADGKENLGFFSNSDPTADRPSSKRKRSLPASSDPLQERKSRDRRKGLRNCQTQPALLAGMEASEFAFAVQ